MAGEGDQKSLKEPDSLRTGSHVSTCRHRNTQKGDGEKNGTRKSEPARELLSFEFPTFDDQRGKPIG